MPDHLRGLCGACGRTLWLKELLSRRLPQHQNLGGAVCAGSGGAAWTRPRAVAGPPIDLGDDPDGDNGG